MLQLVQICTIFLILIKYAESSKYRGLYVSIFHLKPKVRPSNAEILRALVGASLSILVLLLLSQWSKQPLIMAPFGASCVLLYAVSQSPLAQPRNVILGHLLSAAVGLIALKLLGTSIWAIALAVGVAIAVMQYFACVHPPAGANPLVILLTAHQMDYSWHFLFFPVLLGAVILVLIAYVVNNVFSKQKWPTRLN